MWVEGMALEGGNQRPPRTIFSTIPLHNFDLEIAI
jgi:hypothetical protein